jgi:nucleoid DNA-binding protein
LSTTQLIKELLTIKNKVVIPGIGAFEGKRRPAGLNTYGQSISAPNLTVTFDPNNKEDDALITYISNRNKISHDDAFKEVQIFINTLKDSLQKNNAYLIPEIGELSYDAQNNLKFRQEVLSNLLTDSFGLTTVHFNLPQEKKIEQVKPIPDKAVIPNKTTIPDKKIPGKTAIPDKKPVEKPVVKKRKIKAVFVVLPLIFILLAGLGYVGYKKGYVQKVKNIQFSNFNVFKKKTALPQVVVNNIKNKSIPEDTTEVGKSLNKQTDKEKALYYSEKKDSTKPQASTTPVSKFYIIAASFKNKEKAEHMKAKLLAQGFQCEILNLSDNCRISIGSFSDKETALKELFRIRKEKNSQEYWLLSL